MGSEGKGTKDWVFSGVLKAGMRWGCLCSAASIGLGDGLLGKKLGAVCVFSPIALTPEFSNVKGEGSPHAKTCAAGPVEKVLKPVRNRRQELSLKICMQTLKTNSYARMTFSVRAHR